jgi:hypothetical protein
MAVSNLAMTGTMMANTVLVAHEAIIEKNVVKSVRIMVVSNSLLLFGNMIPSIHMLVIAFVMLAVRTNAAIGSTSEI